MCARESSQNLKIPARTRVRDEWISIDRRSDPIRTPKSRISGILAKIPKIPKIPEIPTAGPRDFDPDPPILAKSKQKLALNRIRPDSDRIYPRDTRSIGANTHNMRVHRSGPQNSSSNPRDFELELEHSEDNPIRPDPDPKIPNFRNFSKIPKNTKIPEIPALRTSKFQLGPGQIYLEKAFTKSRTSPDPRDPIRGPKIRRWASAFSHPPPPPEATNGVRSWRRKRLGEAKPS